MVILLYIFIVLTEVIIGEVDCLQGHGHELAGAGGINAVQIGTYWSVWTPNEPGSYRRMTSALFDVGYGVPRYGNTTRPVNISICYWRRFQ